VRAGREDRRQQNQIGAETVSTGFLGMDRKVQARVHDWIITLDTYTSGETDTTYTRIRAPFVNHGGLRFTLFRAGFFTGDTVNVG
jgi:hypothetical protein